MRADITMIASFITATSHCNNNSIIITLFKIAKFNTSKMHRIQNSQKMYLQIIVTLRYLSPVPPQLSMWKILSWSWPDWTELLWQIHPEPCHPHQSPEHTDLSRITMEMIVSKPFRRLNRNWPVHQCSFTKTQGYQSLLQEMPLHTEWVQSLHTPYLMAQRGPLSYLIRVGCGQLWTRHADHASQSRRWSWSTVRTTQSCG